MTRRSIIVLAALALLVCYASTIKGMFDQWMTDEDMGHGLLVPVVIGFVVWKERSRWQTLKPEPNLLFGIAVLGLGAMLQLASALGAGLFAGSLAFVISAAGIVLSLGGFQWLRVWAFPFALSLFMLPKLAVVYNQLTLPLQSIATRMAGGMLTLAGFAVTRSGNILNVRGHEIEVVEACDGVRYLLPLAFLAVVIAYVADSKPWMRIALLAGAVPLAIFANAVRVAASGAVPSLVEGAMHAGLGVVIFLLSLATLIAMQRLVNAAYHRHAS